MPAFLFRDHVRTPPLAMLWALAVLCLLTLAPAVPAAAPYIPQEQDRYRIMVFGDRMATGLLAGLWRVLKGDERFEAKGRLREATGLTRPRLLDWNRVIPSTLDSRPIDIGIVMLGANDARDIVENGQVLKFATEAWKQAYEKRWNTLIGHFRQRGIPLYIVGLPPVRDPRLNEALRLVDGIIRRAAAANGVRYVDIYREFADENGGYAESGFDINGRYVRLRARNGIQFIRPGNTKLASIVANAIIRDVEAAARAAPPPAAADGETPGLAASEYPIVGRATPRGGTETVPLNLLPEENATELAVTEGPDAFSLQRALRAVPPDSAAAALFGGGLWPRPPRGRTDDFSLSEALAAPESE
jgi:hypothetical protein